MEPYEHYLHYLGRFGIVDPGSKVREHVALALGDFRAYSLSSETSGPFRALAAAQGLVGAGRQSDDAWQALLNAGTAAEVAGRIAWLETVEEADLHRPSHTLVLVTPDRRSPALIDPAHWALVEPPRFEREDDGGIRSLTAWYAPGGSDGLHRWHIVAPRTGSAQIDVRSSASLVKESPDRIEDALQRLHSTSLEERLWAVRTLGEQGDRDTVSSLVPLLRDPDREVRSASATALATIGDPATLSTLGEAVDQAEEADRGHIIQVLARFGDAASPILGRLATPGASTETRLDIVHALGQIAAPAAQTVLERLARDDDDDDVRSLARTYADVGAAR